MINVSRKIPVNGPGFPVLGRADVWQGLVMKANNALPFVPAMTYCEVTERLNEHSFIRQIEFRGERCHEKITLTPQELVLFERLDGSVLGNIRNTIEEDADGLGLRFSFSLTLAGIADGSVEEQEYAKIVEKDYLKAVDATLGAIRKMKQERTDLIQSTTPPLIIYAWTILRRCTPKPLPFSFRTFPLRKALTRLPRDRPFLVGHCGPQA